MRIRGRKKTRSFTQASLGNTKKGNRVVSMGMEPMSVNAQKHILLVFVLSVLFLGFFSTLGFVSKQLHNKSCNVRHACVIITGIITTMKLFILMAWRGFRALVG